MSKVEIPIRFTPEQKEKLTAFLGKSVNEVLIPKDMGKMIAYGSPLPIIWKTPSILVLTAEQRKIIQKNTGVNCEYIEITKDMTFK